MKVFMLASYVGLVLFSYSLASWSSDMEYSKATAKEYLGKSNHVYLGMKVGGYSAIYDLEDIANEYFSEDESLNARSELLKDRREKILILRSYVDHGYAPGNVVDFVYESEELSNLKVGQKYYLFSSTGINKIPLIYGKCDYFLNDRVGLMKNEGLQELIDSIIEKGSSSCLWNVEYDDKKE
ncbi:hypothetical protein [Teredinibacter sp. KSP-S5-2]|uniref:hypothetical protein n=1 Tax=Teredinibacter sp. KSP-S5-2 TaxID=3034506 RepID=UPI002934853E|nr:hypothetical protein [Teredinibacter sp. KSP-S5-2]WNO10304.1 hypothetical protein P5V12_03870 [Teredinibacter sp. KSP-S5-2]